MSYAKFNLRYKRLMAKRDAITADIYQWRDEFMKFFIPDQEEFDKLKNQAKEYQYKKRSQKEIDEIYGKMAAIYERWLPIEGPLNEMNPAYKPLFDGLKMLLEENKKLDPKKKSEYVEEKIKQE